MKLPHLLLFVPLFATLVATPRSLADHPANKNQLGTIEFAVSGKPAAQADVIRGAKLVHHMMYPEAERAFTGAAAEDPTCALAYWGRAMTLLHPLWPDAPTAAERERGAAQIQLGRVFKIYEGANRVRRQAARTPGT